MAAKLDARSVITRARTKLLFDQRFFARLAMQLKVVEVEAKTIGNTGLPFIMGTDGTRLLYNAEAVEKIHEEPQGIEKIIFIIAHEVMHCANLHMTRRKERDPINWNIATDYTINRELDKCGFTLLEGCLRDAQYDDMSSEEVYNRLPKGTGGNGSGAGNCGAGAPGDGQCQPGQGGGEPPSDPGSSPECDTCPNKDACKAAQCGWVADGERRDAAKKEIEWKVAVQQAATEARASGRGTIPGSIKRMLDEMYNPKVDWKTYLLNFVDRAARNEYNFRTPNKRYMIHNAILPTLRNNELGTLVIGVDTSGSVGQEWLKQFWGEICSIISEFKTTLHVVFCDASVSSVQELGPDNMLEFEPTGGGGTRFEPVFEWVEDNDIEPVCLIYMTDMMGSFPDEPPEYPTLWINCYSEDIEAPFGETIYVDTKED